MRNKKKIITTMSIGHRYNIIVQCTVYTYDAYVYYVTIVSQYYHEINQSRFTYNNPK